MDQAITDGKIKEYMESGHSLYEVLQEMESLKVYYAIDDIKNKQIMRQFNDIFSGTIDHLKDDNLLKRFKECHTTDDMPGFIEELHKHVKSQEIDNMDHLLSLLEEGISKMEQFKPDNIPYKVYETIYNVACKDDLDIYLLFSHLKSIQNDEIMELLVKNLKVPQIVKDKLSIKY